ncbi:MAG: ATP-binding protein [Firmicutes bacterium]|nr:ATP-binding protein [Bacillota bacterium]
MKKFINRNDELSFLEKEYSRDGSSLVVLYGRRRVGKTALTAEFIKNKTAVYFLATKESETQNRIAFKNAVAEQTNNILLMNTNIDNWDMIFKVWLDTDQKEKKLMVIDEFQYLGMANSAFPSIFQRVWDTMLESKNVMIILCGSLISMMVSQTLNYSSPLYGRRTGQIKLKQIPFRFYNEFYPGKTEKELIEYYAITGGVPKYINLFYDSGNIYEAIKNNVLSKTGFLYDEPNFLLQREVSEVSSYFSIIKTIAFGNRKLSKIAAALELKQTGITKYLSTLIGLDILEREVPITESNPEKSKKGLYKIKDNFMVFWFKFIYANINSIERGHEEVAMNKIKTNLADSHVAFVYEDICLEKMWELNAAGTWNFNFDKVGRWWSGDTEIDIVAFDSSGNNIIFGECKYRANKMGLDVLGELERKVSQVAWKKNDRRCYFILFSVSGFSDELMELASIRNDLILME